MSEKDKTVEFLKDMFNLKDEPKGYLTMIDNIDETLSKAMQEWS